MQAMTEFFNNIFLNTKMFLFFSLESKGKNDCVSSCVKYPCTVATTPVKSKDCVNTGIVRGCCPLRLGGSNLITGKRKCHVCIGPLLLTNETNVCGKIAETKVL